MPDPARSTSASHLFPLKPDLERETPQAGLRSPTLGDDLSHRQLLEGEFWRHLPAYADVDSATFLDPSWQLQQSARSVGDLATVVGRSSDRFLSNVQAGIDRASMSLRVTPYILSLIDWENPESDPIRRQFIPLASEKLADHPISVLDALEERSCSPVDRLTHRYPDRVLFVSTDVCPTYCRYCTRSYSVGTSTISVSKHKIRAHGQRWAQPMEYIRSNPAVEDVVVSGGDTYMLKPSELRAIGMGLLDIPHVRRMRFATKGLSVLPMKLASGDGWLDALTEVAERGRALGKEVSVHTHIAHPSEITWISAQASRLLWDRGITVRNQCVLLRGVNDSAVTLRTLIRRLSYINIHPYYIFQHDFVPGVEDLRTPLHTTVRLEKLVRGATAGYNMPTFVVDLLGGGGKRDAHSFEYYDRTTGISVYVSPIIDPDALYYNFDPIDTLPPEGRERWAIRDEIPSMIQEAGRAARSAGESRGSRETTW